jgi:membrane-bound lytic murein transglycosylase D
MERIKFSTAAIILLYIINTPIVANELPNKARPMQRIEVARIDTNGNYETNMVYPDEFIENVFNEKMDSLMNNWYIRNAYNIDEQVKTDTLPEDFLNLGDIEGTQVYKLSIPDSVIVQRLSTIDSPIDLSFNTTVRNVISLYTERRRDQVEIMLGLANYYFPMFEEILDQYNMPLELKYMAIIESALNAKALSRAGACGLWQFMYGTGKMYGLEVTSFVDERRDPLKATDAAARYLNDLYKIYNDWHLVIAAYNCGPGNVNKAIRRAGGARDYWAIYYGLPRETRGYVPAFIAATYTFNFYKLHNLTPRQTNLNIITDTIMVSNYLHFDQLAANLDIDIELLREINPMYRRDIIPATAAKAYPLRLPTGMVNRFIELEEMIFAHNRERHFPNNQIKNPSQSSSQHTPADIKGRAQIYYTVKSGDNVGFISEWFKVRASDLRYWNNINGNLIRVGQRLLIYVPENQADHYKAFNNMSLAQKQAASGKAPVVNNTANATASIDSDYEYYTVRSGDNLWTIAQKYPGISSNEIQNLNNIRDHRSLKVGQQLKIKKK